MMACLGIMISAHAHACHGAHVCMEVLEDPVGDRLLLMAFYWFCCCVHQYASCAPAQKDI